MKNLTLLILWKLTSIFPEIHGTTPFSPISFSLWISVELISQKLLKIRITMSVLKLNIVGQKHTCITCYLFKIWPVTAPTITYGTLALTGHHSEVYNSDRSRVSGLSGILGQHITVFLVVILEIDCLHQLIKSHQFSNTKLKLSH